MERVCWETRDLPLLVTTLERLGAAICCPLSALSLIEVTEDLVVKSVPWPLVSRFPIHSTRFASFGESLDHQTDFQVEKSPSHMGEREASSNESVGECCGKQCVPFPFLRLLVVTSITVVAWAWRTDSTMHSHANEPVVLMVVDNL